ncbi:MAG: hypothetical protein O9353_00150, partial [Bacteroidia bacterium]|nr:hypothetical protein [Bacteroidia bacterium]
MEQIKARQNVATRSIQLNGKLDFKLAPNTNLTLGGAFDYGSGHDFTYTYSLFNPQNNSQTINTTWRTYARINQKFGTPQSGVEKEKTQSLVSNAYFTFLASYEQAKSKTQDDTHKDNLFDYGYIGKFNYNVDTNNFVLQGNTDSLYLQRSVNIRGPISFERSEKNSTSANYTSQVFDYFGTVNRMDNVATANGIRNGDRQNSIYSLFLPTGRQFNGYGFTNRTQLRFASSFSADFKNHAIMVGVEYDQRNQSGYQVNPIGLWERMRLLVNSHLEKGTLPYYQIPNSDPNAPPTYTTRWTYNPEEQTQIDKSLRELLGTTITDQRIINTDALNPEDLKLSMFSASDLISPASGGALVTYYGYDYLGNKDKNSTSIDKFLNDKDANGNNTFHVGAFKPIYVAGYIQDRFDFRDIKFNVGVRVDRFDANQKVLKDKYLFHEAFTAGEIS